MIATIASRVAARRSSGASSQPATAAASSGIALARARSPSSGRAASGTTSESVAATSPSPLWRATTGNEPQAAASAATIPNASGNVLGTTIASVAGSRSASSA